MAGQLETISVVKLHGGEWHRVKHASKVTSTPMTFSVYLPEKAAFNKEEVKVVYWFSGLTCTDLNFTEKSGAQKVAAALGLALVAPDTSPRTPEGQKVEGEDESWDFGSGAGFYLTATRAPFDKNYNMFAYVTQELIELVESNFPIAKGPANRSVMGHSMGGHGALVCTLKQPGFYRSVSAFAPICNPINCAWGQKAFKGYLGDDEGAWKAWDATELAKTYDGPPLHILVDQGTADSFFPHQLLPENLSAACETNAKLTIDVRLDDGYDHSYYFISSFIENHLKFHSEQLNRA